MMSGKYCFGTLDPLVEKSYSRFVETATCVQTNELDVTFAAKLLSCKWFLKDFTIMIAANHQLCVVYAVLVKLSHWPISNDHDPTSFLQFSKLLPRVGAEHVFNSQCNVPPDNGI